MNRLSCLVLLGLGCVAGCRFWSRPEAPDARATVASLESGGASPRLYVTTSPLGVDHLTAGRVKALARDLVATGFATSGWNTVILEDGWQRNPALAKAGRLDMTGSARDKFGRIQPNDNFSEMKVLTRDLHNRGLKVELRLDVSKQGDGFTTSAGHVAEDAAAIASWGFDAIRVKDMSVRPNDWTNAACPFVSSTMQDILPEDLAPEDKLAYVTAAMLATNSLCLKRDFRTLAPEDASLVTNDEVLAIHLDPLKAPVSFVSSEGDVKIFVRELAHEEYALAFVNDGEEAKEMRLACSDLGLRGFWKGRDVWNHADVPVGMEVKTTVPARGIVMLRLREDPEALEAALQDDDDI